MGLSNQRYVQTTTTTTIMRKKPTRRCVISYIETFTKPVFLRWMEIDYTKCEKRVGEKEKERKKEILKLEPQQNRNMWCAI